MLRCQNVAQGRARILTYVNVDPAPEPLETAYQVSDLPETAQASGA